MRIATIAHHKQRQRTLCWQRLPSLPSLKIGPEERLQPIQHSFQLGGSTRKVNGRYQKHSLRRVQIIDELSHIVFDNAPIVRLAELATIAARNIHAAHLILNKVHLRITLLN